MANELMYKIQKVHGLLRWRLSLNIFLLLSPSSNFSDSIRTMYSCARHGAKNGNQYLRRQFLTI